MNLALFDFDKTITNKDCYLLFLNQQSSNTRKWVSNTLLSPSILLYVLGLVSNRFMRRQITFLALRGTDVNKITQLADEFVKKDIPSTINKSVFGKFKQHIKNGDKVVVVSASLEPYMALWCQNMNVELLCSQLEVRNGRYTGNYKGADCCGEEKVRRIKEAYPLEQYDHIYAYGDSTEDLPMLGLADKPNYFGRIKKMGYEN